MSLRVLHITTNSGGGAGIAALRIHQALLKNGVDSHLLFLKGSTPQNIPNVHSIKEFKNPWLVFLIDKLNRILNYRFGIGKPDCFFNSPFSLFRLHKLPFIQDFDLINLHWVVKFIDITSFFSKINKPIVWTMHDMNPFSGGLHYKTDYEEKAYKQLEEKFVQIKKTAYSHARIGIISPSVWLLEESKKAAIFPAQTHFTAIKNPIDIEKYAPSGEADYEKKIVLFIAEKSGDKRKGLTYLYKAVEELKEKQLEWVVLGNPDEHCPKQIKQMGFVSSSEALVQWYKKAGVFVIPSIEDNLPNTVVESLACGTPVVGFDTGGIKDMIKHKENGYLVPLKDTKQLAEGIEYALQHQQELSKNARLFAVKNFASDTVASQYKLFYEKMLS